MFDPYDPTDEFETDGGERRITTITLNAEDLIQFNVNIYEDPRWNYRENPEREDRREYLEASERTLINSRFEYSEVVSLIDGFISEFPTEDISLIEQAAYWERWFSGMHFFRNANHRTGYFSLQEIMEENDVSRLPRLKNVNEEQSETAIDASRRVRQNIEMGEEVMFRKDALYRVWESFFKDILG